MSSGRMTESRWSMLLHLLDGETHFEEEVGNRGISVGLERLGWIERYVSVGPPRYTHVRITRTGETAFEEFGMPPWRIDPREWKMIKRFVNRLDRSKGRP